MRNPYALAILCFAFYYADKDCNKVLPKSTN